MAEPIPVLLGPTVPFHSDSDEDESGCEYYDEDEPPRPPKKVARDSFTIKDIPTAKEISPDNMDKLLRAIEARYKELYSAGVRLKSGKNLTPEERELRRLYSRRRRMLERTGDLIPKKKNERDTSRQTG